MIFWSKKDNFLLKILVFCVNLNKFNFYCKKENHKFNSLFVIKKVFIELLEQHISFCKALFLISS